jgi:hypothetical protein
MLGLTGRSMRIHSLLEHSDVLCSKVQRCPTTATTRVSLLSRGSRISSPPPLPSSPRHRLPTQISNTASSVYTPQWQISATSSPGASRTRIPPRTAKSTPSWYLSRARSHAALPDPQNPGPGAPCATLRQPKVGRGADERSAGGDRGPFGAVI